MTDTTENPPQTCGVAPGLLWPMIALLSFVLGLVLGLSLNRLGPTPTSNNDQLNRLLQLQLEKSISEDLPPIDVEERESN